MALKLWRQSYGAKGIKMHAFIDYHRFGICYHQMSSACVSACYIAFTVPAHQDFVHCSHDIYIDCL